MTDVVVDADIHAVTTDTHDGHGHGHIDPAAGMTRCVSSRHDVHLTRMCFYLFKKITDSSYTLLVFVHVL